MFTVVSNPSDKWPQWATIMAAVGIGMHFSMKLIAGHQPHHQTNTGVASQATRPPPHLMP